MDGTQDQTSPDAPFQWAVVDLMGHTTLAGILSEVEMFGGVMAHLITPCDNGKTVVRLFNRNNIYRLTLCDETTARLVIEHGYLPSEGYFSEAEIERLARPTVRRSAPEKAPNFADDDDGYFDDDDPLAHE